MLSVDWREIRRISNTALGDVSADEIHHIRLARKVSYAIRRKRASNSGVKRFPRLDSVIPYNAELLTVRKRPVIGARNHLKTVWILKAKHQIFGSSSFHECRFDWSCKMIVSGEI